MFDLFGAELPLPVKFAVAFAVVLVLIVAATWLVRRFGGTRLGAAAARGRQPRLAVIDAASVDARRRLVLIRRDNVEHLVLIGGPTDIVVEQNIVRAVPVAAQREAPPAARPYSEAPPREAAPRQPEPRQPEPRQAEPSWTPQPEPVARHQRPAEPAWAPQPEPAARAPRPAEPTWTPQAEPPARPPRAAEPAWSPQPEPVARQNRPVEPKAPAVDLPQRPLPEPVTAALRAASGPEPTRATARMPPRAPAPPPPPPPVPAPAAIEPEQPVEVRQSPPTADVNLADMAQRLEAALRRPARPAESRAPAPAPRTEPRPPREPARPTPAAVAPPVVPVNEPQRAAPEMPRATTISEPPPAPAPEPPKPVEAAAEPKPAPKSVFDSLEEEMANLLGKPPGKP